MAVRCIDSFAICIDGRHKVVKAGQVLRDTDPVVVGREHLFEDVEATIQTGRSTPVVEQATAAPGEKRNVSRARKAAD